MKKCIFILLALLFMPVYSILQQVNEPYRLLYEAANKNYELDNPTKSTDSLALLNYSKTIELIRNKPYQSKILFDCYIKSGNIYQGQQKYQQSIPYYHFVLKEALPKKDTLSLYQANLYMGSSKYSLNEIDSATYYLENAYSYLQNNKQLPDAIVLFNSLGIIYFESANYGQAMNYFQLASDGLKKGDEAYEESLVSFENNIAACLGKLGKNLESLRVYKSLLRYKQLSGSLMQNVGHAYYSLRQYDSALLFLNKVPFSKTSNHVRLINEKARIYMQKGQLALAENYFDSAISLNRQLPGNLKNKDKANSYLYRAQLAFRQGLPDEAITWCNVALEELHFTFKWSKTNELPVDVTQVVSPVTFFEVLKFKADLQQQKYKATKNSRFLEQALQTWKLAAKTSNYIKASFDNDEAELFFNEGSGTMYKSASLAAAHLFEETGNDKYINDYLFLTESFKGNIVFRNLREAAVKSNGALPDSLLRKEKELKQLLAVFTTRLNNLTSAEGLSLVQKKITGIQVELSRLQKKFEQFAQYNNATKPNIADSISLIKVQQSLSNDAAALQYLWCDSELVCFSVTRSQALIHTKTISENIKNAINVYISALYTTPEGIRFDKYQPAEILYHFLLEELARKAGEKKQLIILPDGPLNYLPFEALATDDENKKWLVFDKVISYHYSFSLLLNKKPINNSAKIIFAATPFSENGSTIQHTVFSKLPYSLNETENLKGYKVNTFAATRKSFTDNSTNASLIHLATHAAATADTAGRSQTFIQFFYTRNKPVENSRLYLHEIYNLRFSNHPLIILSACETAAGNSTAGEGLLSLSRAFLYAGASGIISSLWKAEDKVTANLMSRFHFYSQKGIDTETALQKARIDFLKDDLVDVRLKTPNYWAHFIYIGETGREVHTSSGRNSLVLIAGMIFLMMLILFLVRFFFKSRKVSAN